MEIGADPDEGTGVEGGQPERVVVEEVLGGGVGGQQDLEAAVEAEAVDVVGADAAAGSVGALEDERLVALLPEPDRRREAGETGADDDHIMRGHGCIPPRRVTKGNVTHSPRVGRGGDTRDLEVWVTPARRDGPTD